MSLKDTTQHPSLILTVGAAAQTLASLLAIIFAAAKSCRGETLGIASRDSPFISLVYGLWDILWLRSCNVRVAMTGASGT